MIDEAHGIIIAEELKVSGRADLMDMFVQAVVQANAGLMTDRVQQDVVRKLRTAPPTQLHQILQQCLNPQDLLKYFDDAYEVDRKQDPQKVVRTLARATPVVGKMLESLAKQYQMEGSRVVWLTRLGQLFWGIVEVAVPQSLANIIARHALQLLYLLEILLILGGTVFATGWAQRFGAATLAATILIHLAILWVQDIFAGRRFVKMFVLSAFLIVLGLVFGTAGYAVWEHWSSLSQTVVDVEDWLQNNKLLSGAILAGVLLPLMAVLLKRME